MASESPVELGAKLLQRGGSQGGGGRAGCPEQRLNSSENWFLQLPRRPALWQETHCSEAAEPALGMGTIWRSGGHREVSEHLHRRLPGSSARGRCFSPLTLESLCAFPGTLQGLSPSWRFLQDAHTSSSFTIKEVTTQTSVNIPALTRCLSHSSGGFKVQYKHQLRWALQKRCAQEEVRANRSLFCIS